MCMTLREAALHKSWNQKGNILTEHKAGYRAARFNTRSSLVGYNPAPRQVRIPNPKASGQEKGTG